jgi:plasmid stability protein
MEEEAREILKVGVAMQEPKQNLYQAIRAIVEPLGGIDLPEFPDEPVGDPITFD